MGSNRPERDEPRASALPGEVRPSGVYPSGTVAAPARLPSGSRGPRTPFEDVYERHFRLVWSRIYRAKDLESQWDDIFQDVFVVVNALIQKKRMPEDLPPLLVAITENQIKNRRRGQRRSHAQIDPDAAADSVAQPSSRSSPERLLDRARWRQVVTTTLDGMPEHHAEVLRLTELDEVSQVEAAARMSCAEGTVRSRRSRALDYIRALLARAYKKDSR